MKVSIEQKLDSSEGGLPIECIEFHDFARTFRIEYCGNHLVFDAPFLDGTDEYSDYYIVYMTRDYSGRWQEKYREWRVYSIIPASKITLDETRKKFMRVDLSVFLKGLQ
jgi:hypothetical protein